ncbi:MAG: hypothetical protein VSS75_027900 [Candidatus Parabeggiatoa sp.]
MMTEFLKSRFALPRVSKSHTKQTRGIASKHRTDARHRVET